MKLIKCVLPLIIIASLFSGCSNKNTESSSGATSSQSIPKTTTEVIESSSESVQDASEDKIQNKEDDINELSSSSGATAEGTKQVGEEQYGFWNIPQSWVVFKELDPAEGDHPIQYSDKEGKNIITVRYLAGSDKTPDDLMQREGAFMKKLGGQDITGARVKLNGIDTLQLYCSFPDNTIMVTWGFKSYDDVFHTIIAEGPVATIADTVGYLESSYTLKK